MFSALLRCSFLGLLSRESRLYSTCLLPAPIDISRLLASPAPSRVYKAKMIQGAHLNHSLVPEILSQSVYLSEPYVYFEYHVHGFNYT